MNFDPTIRSIKCSFLNQPQGTVKYCNVSVAYGDNCDQQLGKYSSVGRGDSLTTQSLMLEAADGVNEFCFCVTASSDGKTVIVEGTLDVLNFGKTKHDNVLKAKSHIYTYRFN